MQMTYRIEHSLGLDAANRQMRAEGQTTWVERETALAAPTLRELYPLCAELPGIDPFLCGCSRCC